MKNLNSEWAIAQLDKFIDQTTLRRPDPIPGVADLTGRRVTSSSNEEVIEQAQTVEPIFDRVIPDWRLMEVGKSNRWERHREAAIRAKEALARADELRQNLGEVIRSRFPGDSIPWKRMEHGKEQTRTEAIPA